MYVDSTWKGGWHVLFQLVLIKEEPFPVIVKRIGRVRKGTLDFLEKIIWDFGQEFQVQEVFIVPIL